jgi:CRISPR/Cas system-associated endonuclease Cas1
LSPLARHHQHQATPLTARYQNLAWVNKITSKMYEKGSDEIRQIYQQGTSNSYDEYESEAMEKILQSINEFTPSCMDFNKRKHSVYTFFLYFIRKIYD